MAQSLKSSLTLEPLKKLRGLMVLIIMAGMSRKLNLGIVLLKLCYPDRGLEGNYL